MWLGLSQLSQKEVNERETEKNSQPTEQLPVIDGRKVVVILIFWVTVLYQKFEVFLLL